VIPAPAASRAYAGSLALDVFRGLAAVLMVLNHAGFAWLDAAATGHGVSGLLVFTGSLAPVLFFLATGSAIGLAGGGRASPGDWTSLAWKAALLLVADQLAILARSQQPGLDFFGFIALAMVVVTVVDRQRQPVRLACVLATMLLVMRLGVGPMLPPEVQRSPWGSFIFGAFGRPNVGYPLAPWMVFPLLGYALARAGLFPSDLPGQLSDESGRRRRAWMAAVSVALLVATAGLAAMGKSFFRWGVMNAPFLVLSLGSVLFAAMLCSFAAARWPQLFRHLALRGPAAYLVVPMHYGLIHVTKILLPAPWSPLAYVAGALCLVVLSIGLSRKVAAWIAGPSTAAAGGWLALAFCGLAMLAASLVASQTHLAMGLATLGQVAVGALLGVRWRRRLAEPSPPGRQV
jgi:hypothetical protein